MSMTGDSEAVLNQIRDIQGKDIPLEEKNSLINKILGKRWVLNINEGAENDNYIDHITPILTVINEKQMV